MSYSASPWYITGSNGTINIIVTGNVWSLGNSEVLYLYSSSSSNSRLGGILSIRVYPDADLIVEFRQGSDSLSVASFSDTCAY